MGPQYRNPLRDSHFGVAILAGIIVWAAMWWWSQTTANFSWPFQAPSKFLMLVIVYPVLEEIVFRGGLQTWLLKYQTIRVERRGVSLANLITSIVFASSHFIIHGSLIAASTFAPSLVYGYFRDRHKSLIAPMVLHAYYNAGYFLIFPPY